MRFLISGPLADPALLQAVLARPVASAPAGAPILLTDAEERARLLYYAAALGAEPHDAPDGAVALRLPEAGIGGVAAGGAPLSERWAAIWREAVPEILGYRGQFTPAEVTARLRQIWARADSRLRGRAERRVPPSGLNASNVHLRGVERPYSKYFTVEDLVYDHDRFEGGRNAAVARAVFVGADAVTVLPWDPVRDRVLLVEQLRAGPISRADPVPWMLEAIAGRIEPGDDPEGTARKEAQEEARLDLGALHFLGSYYPSNGAFSEYLYSYVGIADLPDGAATVAGVAEEAEDIRSHVMPRAELMRLIAEGQAPQGPLQLSAYWLALNAERLRGAG